MCEHEWITAIGHRGEHGKLGKVVCWNCGKTKDEIDLEQQLAAANARVAELEATLKEIAKGNIVYPDLFAQQSLKDTKNSGCPYGVQPSKRCCKVCNELENILFKCNQEIVKQACKTEQLQQQLVAAKQRAEAAEAQAAELQQVRNLLPDDYSESKDWKSGNVLERIEWLKIMLQAKREEVESKAAEIDRKNRHCCYACLPVSKILCQEDGEQ